MREIAAFPSDRAALLWDKIDALVSDPLPDGKVKKKLKGADGVYRMRVTDHRVNVTLHQIDTFMQGMIEPVIEPLRAAFEAEALAFLDWVQASPQREGYGPVQVAGDAERAFSYAAPAIRAQFGDAQRFMAMVAGSYPMVIRPASTVFFQPTLDADGDVLQVVQLRDTAGKLWRASYLLARQPGNAWRIAGCVVAPDTGAGTT